MNLLLTGSVAFDYLMTFPGYFREHILPEKLGSISLSFLVDGMTRLRGGIAPNIAYTLALLGERPRLWATVGEDFEEYRQWLESKGVDTSGARVIPGEFTASFFVNTDRDNCQIASFYPGAMGRAAELSLHELEQDRPDLVMISPNDPHAMRQYGRECLEMGIPYIYDPSQQIVRMSAEELGEGIAGAFALFVNDYESALVEKMTGLTPENVIERNTQGGRAFVAVTRGAEGVTIYSKQGFVQVQVVSPVQISDPTGVGDAFRGGFLKGFIHGLDFTTCAQMGVLAATYCLENRGPQGQSYDLAEFVRRFRANFDDKGKLDQLLNKDGKTLNHQDH
jgi:adenosine kinase